LLFAIHLVLLYAEDQNMSFPSQARIEANRRNGKQGRGPNTAHGKRRSSLNAIRHGLTGRIVVLPTEDLEVYTAFSKELVDSLNPETPLERQYAQTVADIQWRLNRARSIEDGMLAMGHYEDEGAFDAASPEIHSALTAAKVFRERSKDFVNLSLYEQRLARSQKEALRQLRELQSERKAAEHSASEESPRIAQSAGSGQGREPQAILSRSAPGQRRIPEVIGFVYSSAKSSPVAPQTPVTIPSPTTQKTAA
jgi:hypothetical protein